MSYQSLQPEERVPRVSFFILVFTIIVFAAQATGGETDALIQMLGYHPDLVKQGQIWRLVTYMLVHGDFLHMAFNMYGVYLFGMSLETILGSRRFLAIYMLGGIMGPLISTVASLMMSDIAAVIGASGGVLAIIGAMAILAPDVTILAFMFIPMKLRTLAIVYGIMSIIGVGQGERDGVSHSAHLAGLVTGFVLASIFAGQLMNQMKTIAQKATGQGDAPKGHGFEGQALHKCAVCGATEKTHPNEEFRVCSKCIGGLEYCSKHINNHEHKT